MALEFKDPKDGDSAVMAATSYLSKNPTLEGYIPAKKLKELALALGVWPKNPPVRRCKVSGKKQRQAPYEYYEGFLLDYIERNRIYLEKKTESATK